MRSEPKAIWEDERVQKVYQLLVDDDNLPLNEAEHWEGFVARQIVDALFPSPSSTPSPQPELLTFNKWYSSSDVHPTEWDSKEEAARAGWDALYPKLSAVLAQLASAQQERETILTALALMYDKWEFGCSVTEGGEEDGSYLGNSVHLSYEEEESVIALLKGRERIQTMNDGKPSWRERAETAEATVARLEQQVRDEARQDLATAKSEGRREGLERAAEPCDSIGGRFDSVETRALLKVKAAILTEAVIESAEQRCLQRALEAVQRLYNSLPTAEYHSCSDDRKRGITEAESAIEALLKGS
jgi:hypothetical protein